MSSSSKSVVVGYQYYSGAHLVICHGPVDSILKIEVDDRVAWEGNNTGGQISISAPNLFGGEKREGGVSGLVDVMMGMPNQAKNDYLQARLGSVIPAFRGVVSLVLRQCYMGNNPYLKPWVVWAKRIMVRTNGSAQWYSTKAAIGDDMNPAHIIRECLTDTVWGMGYPEIDMDETSFQSAADTLHTEGMGMSLLWDKAQSIGDFITMVLDHIQGVLYVDRSSGKFKMNLVRGGYVVASLPVLDETCIVKVSNYRRGQPSEQVNTVTVVYCDGPTNKKNSLTVQDTALVAQMGSSVGITKQYLGFSSGAIASRAASRDLAAMSSPLSRCVVYANRRGSILNVGDPFIMSYPSIGVDQVVMRVTEIDMGDPEANTIKITCVEDVFGSVYSQYSAPPGSLWTNPVTEPANCPHAIMVEASYWELVQRLGDSQAAQMNALSGFLLAAGVRPSDDSVNADLYVNSGAGFQSFPSNSMSFCPSAVLAANESKTSTTWAISGGVDLDEVLVGSYAMVDNELFKVSAISSSSVSVVRGMIDTVPQAHNSGARIWFLDVAGETDNVEYASGDSLTARICPTTGKGTLAIGLANNLTITLSGRQGKPYPPGKFRINTQLYPTSVARPLALSWAHRDRKQQTAGLIDQETGNIGPEAGVTYTARLLTLGGGVLETITSIAGTSTTFAYNVAGDYTVELWSVRDGIASLQKHSHTFTLT